MMSIFAAFVVVPSLLTASFAMIFLKKSLGAWFHGQVRTVLEDSSHIAQSYLQEHERGLAFIVSTIAKGLCALLDQEGPLNTQHPQEEVPGLIDRHSQDVDDYLNVHEALRNVHCLLIAAPPQPGTAPKILASSARGPLNLGLSLNSEAFDTASTSGVKATLYPDAGFMSVLMPLPFLPGTYLFVTRSIDMGILTKIHQAKSATQAYHQVLQQQQTMAWRFAGMLAVVTVLLLVLAIGSGLILSRKIVTPVAALIQGAQAVRAGNIAQIDSQHIPATQALRALLETFDAMATEIVERKQALEQANLRLNARTIALESVLTGVSSGVISATLDGRILLVNQRAQEVLALRGPLEGRRLKDTMPEALLAFDQAVQCPGKLLAFELTASRLGKALTLRLHLVAHQTSNQVIITFEDIGPLILAQKKSAWSDVAQRVAHEIKNPLTPITLSAQRLQRRYGSKIQDDPSVFQDCLDTIIRQVRHIGTLVSEFTAFARLPAPKLGKVDLELLIQQEVHLCQEAYPHIQFQCHLRPTFVWADGGQIGQVLTNILKNAIESIGERASPALAGIIQIHLDIDQDQAVLSICDNGVGLSEGSPSLEKAGMSTKIHGMGLGLAIVQKIIQDHGGHFTLGPGPFSAGGATASNPPHKGNPKGGSAGACARMVLPLWQEEGLA